MSKYA